MARKLSSTVLSSTILRLIGLSTLGLVMTGCVSQEKYNAMKLDRDEAHSAFSEAEARARTADAQYAVLKHQFEMKQSSESGREALNANQAATIADLTRQLDELNAKYRDAIDLAGKAGSTPLPVAVTNELNAFAAANPGLVDFDSSRGLVKFKSDLTFSAGSAEVQPTAKQAIDKFAQILNSSAAAPYELMVVGHTDSQPVSNPMTLKAGHLDNWYLSAHRAIAVSKELQRQGVASGRLEVAGYADQRPVDPSPTKDAMSKNRRVEVLILPTTHTGSVAAATPAPSASAIPAAAPIPARSTARVSMNKDDNKDAPPARPYLGK